MEYNIQKLKYDVKWALILQKATIGNKVEICRMLDKDNNLWPLVKEIYQKLGKEAEKEIIKA